MRILLEPLDPRGRIDRSTWWLLTVVLALAGGSLATFGVMALIAISLGGATSEELPEAGEKTAIAITIGLAVVVVLIISVWLAQSARRFHDLGLPGSLVIVPWVGTVILMLTLDGNGLFHRPFVHLLWLGPGGFYAVCGLVPGTNGPNRHGPKPVVFDVPPPPANGDVTGRSLPPG